VTAPAAVSPEARSYYGRAVLKEPVWKWPIPAYFFCGGLAGASSLLAAVARVAGGRTLAQRARLTALVALGASGGLLVKDLGRPGRFYNMLRVAKVTSPMSVGTWLLSAYGPAAGAAALGGAIPALGVAGDVAAGALGTGVATYTAVLLADTAVPAWKGARRELPFLFAAGAAASAGAVASMLNTPADAAPARRLAVGAVATELAVEQLLERRLGDVAEVFHLGTARRLFRASKGCSAAGAVILALFGRRRPLAVAGGALVATGAALTRFAVFEAGKASARDPRYVVGPQRAALSGS
jgi:formate-dependent nitrite reductase membrane component NrfD